MISDLTGVCRNMFSDLTGASLSGASHLTGTSQPDQSFPCLVLTPVGEQLQMLRIIQKGWLTIYLFAYNTKRG